MVTQKLLEDALNEAEIAETQKFLWYVTPIGIAALCKIKLSQLSSIYHEDAVKEALEVGLDLTREESEEHYLEKGWLILFYS